jgi:hypothetical protein
MADETETSGNKKQSLTADSVAKPIASMQSRSLSHVPQALPSRERAISECARSMDIVKNSL